MIEEYTKQDGSKRYTVSYGWNMIGYYINWIVTIFWTPDWFDESHKQLSEFYLINAHKIIWLKK